MTTEFDQLHRYLFANKNVRGEMVRLAESYQQILAAHDYPRPVQRLLGELMVASSLLTATLKFEGDIAVQVQSEGPVKYAVINGTESQQMRGVARWQGEVPEDFSDMFYKGVLVITITPRQGERYQGVVPLDKPSLAACLEAYFAQSEQLPTRVKMHVQPPQGDAGRALAAGLLLQVLPVAESGSEDDFEELVALTDTATAEELFTLPAEELLYRLYHQQEVELLPVQDVCFQCSCSKERSAQALASVEKAELLSIIEQEGDIAMACQYCNSEYRFDAIDVEAIHAGTFGQSGQPS